MEKMQSRDESVGRACAGAGAISAAGVSSMCGPHGARWTDGGWKVIYHVVYPWLVFPCNTMMLKN